MTDWRAFCSAAAKVTANYSNMGLKRSLVYLDPGILAEISLKDRFLAGCGITHFGWGRAICFAKLFRHLKERNPDLFLSAPPEGILAYNALVSSLFAKDVAREFLQAPKVQVVAKAKSVAVAPKEEVISAQEREKRELEQHRAREAQNVKQQAGPYLQKLLTPELSPYTDLPKEASRILAEQFELPPLEGVDIETVKKECSKFYGNLLQQMANLVSAGKDRNEKIEKMSSFCKIFLTISAPIHSFKDVQAEFHAFEEAVQSLNLTTQDLAKGTFLENETKLQTTMKRFLEIESKLPNFIDRMQEEARKSLQHTEDAKAAVKRRLLEIFWAISPYQDLAEDFQNLRKLLTERLREISTKFYAGEMSSGEVLSSVQEMPYEHDVVKLRNELTHRAARLKDLRDELLRLYREVQEVRRFCEIAHIENASELLDHESVIKNILSDVENPFRSFAKAVTKDDINLVYRKFWIRVEEIQPKIERALVSANEHCQNKAIAIKDAFLKALDTLEECLEPRPQLVVQAEATLQQAASDTLFRSVLSLLHSTEKRYIHAVPFSFFMKVPDHKTRLKMMQEAMALDEMISGTIQFAKAMQYVKTFEEERVDVILEAFERWHLLEDADFGQYVERMQRAAALVEDEIFLDIGLLDRHALMDVDPMELNKTLKVAINRARRKTPLQPLVYDEKYLLCAKKFQDLKMSLDLWAKEEVDENRDTDLLLDHLRNYCHHLFDAKILLGSNAGMLLPKCLDFMNDLRIYARLIEELLQEKRGLHRERWGTPFIVEAHAILAAVESFEPEEETSNAFQPILKKLQNLLGQIPEHAELLSEQTFQELTEHLQEIDKICERPRKEHPFIYIPGYIAFFESGEKP